MIDLIIIFALGFMPAIVLHEFAHGWMAHQCGDPTAKQLGRLTLNPIAHVDPIGTVALPLGLLFINMTGLMHVPIFGWAKPVPVDYRRLNNPKRDMALVGVAGPIINIIIAFIFGRLWTLGLWAALDQPVTFFGYQMAIGAWVIVINVGLAVFNMLPIPPLDGSRLVAAFLPENLARSYHKIEPYGIIIVILLLNFGMLRWLAPIVFIVSSLLAGS